MFSAVQRVSCLNGTLNKYQIFSEIFYILEIVLKLNLGFCFALS